MKTIILFQPRIGFWEDFNPDPMTPLGPLRIASLLSKEYDVMIIDQRVNQQWEDELIDCLQKDVVCVGITCMTGIQINFALKAAEIIRKHSKVPIVWGGVHPTLNPSQTLNDDRVDYVVIGEGEYTFKELVDALDNKNSVDGVKGLGYLHEGNVVINPPREFCNMDELPFLPLDILDFRRYFDVKKEIYMETSRGCPFQCGYCYNKSFNKGRFRLQSASRVLKEAEYYITKYGIKMIFFVDDEFFLDPERARAIAQGLKKFKIRWECQGIRIDSILKLDDGLINDLVESGCSKFLIGIETGSPRMLEYIKKGINVGQVVEAVKKMAKYPIDLRMNFMAGFPNETLEDMRKTAKLMVELVDLNPRAKIAFLSIYKPYPGTFLYSEALKLGYKEPDSLVEWGKFNWEQANSSFLSPKVKRLLEGMHICAYGLRINDSMDSVPFGLNFISRFYGGIARYRFSHFYFGLCFEKVLKKLFIKD
ncbi:MAG: B12-binding domain-containing radical SAM protein [Nanoarchaeota archaeon]|nr:B12-binding domain-containing radical SAM protein [Nanoarchaeota archaeon]